jgi:hypothetical protein
VCQCDRVTVTERIFKYSNCQLPELPHLSLLTAVRLRYALVRIYSLLYTGAVRTASRTPLKDDVTTYRRATATGDESTRCPGTSRVV